MHYETYSGGRGRASGGGALGLVQNLILASQGGPSHNLSNRQDLAWDTLSGASFYRVFRNGTLYQDNIFATTFADTAATNCWSPTYDGISTGYYYQVAGVDAQNNQGPLTTDIAVYSYWGSRGGSQWGGVDFSFSMVSEDYNDTTGAPVGGGVCMKLVYPATQGGGGIFSAGWQPYSGPPQVQLYALDLAGFIGSGQGGFLQFDIKPMASGNTYSFSQISRVPNPPGDAFPWEVPHDISSYGALTIGAWNSVKIPLSDCSIGLTTFTGSIGAPYGTANGNPYATLNVSGSSGVGVDSGGKISGSGVPAGTYIDGNGQSNTNGTFQVQGPGITGSTVVSSTSMTCQRTCIYKPALVQVNGGVGGTVYVNNMRYTAQ